MNNPFFKINKTDIAANAGKILAVDIETGDILVVKSDIEILQHTMRTLYPGVKYAYITMPKEEVD